MGESTGEPANLWRHEFEKNGIGYDEIVLIGNNLGELPNPTFIPNVFELIRIVKKIQNDPERKVAHERLPRGLPKDLPRLLSESEAKERLLKTEKTRGPCLSKIRGILNAS